MSSARSISVVIPVYNEEEILGQSVRRILDGLRALGLESFEVLLCENGSRDSTRHLAEDLAAGIPEVRLLTLGRPDYGAAMRVGFLAATGEVIVNFDADYYDLSFLRDALVQEADVVVASKGLVESQDARTLLRRMASRGFGWIARRMLDLHVTETHGMKLFRAGAIKDIVPEVEATKDLFDTELVARADRAGLAIRELPIRTEEMRHSRSGLVRRVPRTLWGLLRLRSRLPAPGTRIVPRPQGVAAVEPVRLVA